MNFENYSLVQLLDQFKVNQTNSWLIFTWKEWWNGELMKRLPWLRDARRYNRQFPPIFAQMAGKIANFTNLKKWTLKFNTGFDWQLNRRRNPTVASCILKLFMAIDTDSRFEWTRYSQVYKFITCTNR